MPKEIIIGVYSITNVLNNKKYIGSSFNIYDRWKGHRVKMLNDQSNKRLQNAINKYSIENFKFEILESFNKITKDQLVQIEQAWCDFYQVTTDKGYNVRKICESNKGAKFPTGRKNYHTAKLFGKKCLLYNLDGTFFKECESYAEVKRITSSGTPCSAIKSKYHKLGNFLIFPYINNYQLQVEPYIRKMSPYSNPIERGRKISNNQLGKFVSQETRDKQSKAKQGIITWSAIQILQFDLDGNFINEYLSLGKASEATGVCSKLIKKIALEENKHDFNNLYHPKHANLYKYKWVLV